MNLICNHIPSIRNNAHFKIKNLFQEDWYIREHSEHNVNFAFAYVEFLVRNVR